MRLPCIAAASGFLIVQAAFAQHGPHMATPPAPKPKKVKGGGANAGLGAPKRASDEQIEQLEKMSPADRQQALEALPADRRQKIEQRLTHLQSLSPRSAPSLRIAWRNSKACRPPSRKRCAG